jgi:hypothetical protein
VPLIGSLLTIWDQLCDDVFQEIILELPIWKVWLFSTVFTPIMAHHAGYNFSNSTCRLVSQKPTNLSVIHTNEFNSYK